MRRGLRKIRGTDSVGKMDRWLVSYADFVTLLMVFFILMYALSKIDVDKYNAIAESLSIVLTGSSLQDVDTVSPSAAPTISALKIPDILNPELTGPGQLEEVQEQIEKFIRNDQPDDSGMAMAESSRKLEDYITIIEQERGLVISVKDTFLFPSGSDELNPKAQEIILRLGKGLLTIPNHIRVEGHTDDLSINTAKFPSNWELSMLRAGTVLHVLQDEVGIEPERLSVVGYGEYQPLVPNIDSTSRAINRRVDIVILKQKYADF